MHKTVLEKDKQLSEGCLHLPCTCYRAISLQPKQRLQKLYHYTHYEIGEVSNVRQTVVQHYEPFCETFLFQFNGTNDA